jgi:DNA polymerase
MSENVEKCMLEINESIKQCKECPLHKNRIHPVPGEGNLQAKIMFLGEAPGRMEDDDGKPFIGRSGKYLTQLLEANGFSRSDVYITNAVKCRPPENRAPTDMELTACRAFWLNRQIELINPRLIVLLGKVPLRQMLNEIGALRDIHGQVRQDDCRKYYITFHPAAALRSPAMRAMMEEDFKKIHTLI